MCRKSIVLGIAMIILLGVASSRIYAQEVPILIPNLLNYQGKLVKNTPRGPVPLTGTYKVMFRIYDISGALLWEEERDVEVNTGIFNVTLGEVTPLTILFDQDYWLGVQVESDPEMTPRQRIASTGYSFMAQDTYSLNGVASGAGNGLIADMVDDKHYSDIAKEIDDDAAIPDGGQF